MFTYINVHLTWLLLSILVCILLVAIFWRKFKNTQIENKQKAPVVPAYSDIGEVHSDAHGTCANSNHSYRMLRASDLKRFKALWITHVDPFAGIHTGVFSEDDIEEKLLLRTTKKKKYERAPAVDCSVFGPPSPVVDREFLIQAILHDKEELRAALKKATGVDQGSNRLAVQTLEVPMDVGDQIELFLECPDLNISNPLQTLEWESVPACCEFVVSIPRDVINPIRPQMLVIVNGVHIGDISFVLRPVSSNLRDKAVSSMSALIGEQENRLGTTSTLLGERADRYSTAFISYSRKDFEKVSLFAEALEENGVTNPALKYQTLGIHAA